MSRQLITIAEAAKRLSMSRAWVYDHSTRKHPRVPMIRIGGCLRYDVADLDRFIEEQAELSKRRSLHSQTGGNRPAAKQPRV